MGDNCKERVFSNSIWDFRGHMCTKKVWKDGFCKTHHPESKKLRQIKQQQKWDEERKNSCWYKLEQAIKRIKELEEQINATK